MKNQLPRRLVPVLFALLALLLLPGLLRPFPVAEPEAEARLTPLPTDPPVATPVPAGRLERGEGIYYSYDPSLFVTDERGRITYSDPAYTSLTGIDVSEFQYDINWQQVKEDGIDFAIIRTGYRGYSAGSLYEDKYFRKNIAGATAAGLPIGVYFFSTATTPREAREEAAFILSQIEGYDVTLPIVFDLEILSEEYRTYTMDRRTLYRTARAFCDAIEESGHTPAIYMTQYLGYRKYILRDLADVPFWYAEYYVNSPTFVFNFDIWQYSDTGSVAGINGNVDLDLYLIPKEG